MKRKILIVDDSKEILDNLKEVVEALGFQADTAESAVEGLEKYKNNDYSIVFTDIYMPGMDGMDFLHEIKKINPDEIVVVMTAYPSSETIMETIIADGYTYIEKPFMFDKIKNLLENASKRAEEKKLKSE